MFRISEHEGVETCYVANSVPFQKLPEDLICRIFDKLSVRSRHAGSDSLDAMSLSQTCQCLNRIYREVYVESIEVIQEELQIISLLRTLARYPRAEHIEIGGYVNRKGGGRSRTGNESAVVPSNTKRVVSVTLKGVSLPSSALEKMGHHFPNLRKLRFESCTNLSDSSLKSAISNRFESLELLALSGLRLAANSVTDNVGKCFPKMQALTYLDISNSTTFQSTTFNAISFLTNLRVLAASNTSVSHAPLCSAIASLSFLEKIDISNTKQIQDSLLVELPCTLRELNICNSHVLRDTTSTEMMRHLKELRRVHLTIRTNGPLSSLLPLSSVIPQLELLDLKGSTLVGAWHAHQFPRMRRIRHLGLEQCDIPGGWPLSVAKSLPELESISFADSRGMQEELQSLIHMKSLRHLDLSGCRNVGNPTAFSVASLPKLESLSMTSTMIGKSGADAIADGQCKKSLRVFRIFPMRERARNRTKGFYCAGRVGHRDRMPSKLSVTNRNGLENLELAEDRMD